jgi:hypothetical protein
MLIRIRLFTLMRIWIRLFTSMRIRIRILMEVMGNINRWPEEPPGLYASLFGSTVSLHGSKMAIHGSIVSLHSSWLLTLLRIRSGL